MARYISPLATDTEVNNCYLTLFIYAIYFMSKALDFFLSFPRGARYAKSVDGFALFRLS